MTIKAHLPRRSFLSTSVKSVAFASIGAVASIPSSAQTPEPAEGDIIIRKTLPVTSIPNLYELNETPGVVRSSRAVREINFTVDGQSFTMAIDPSTIKTIVEIGIFIYGLFGGGNEKPGDWLTKISDQLTRIQSALETVQKAIEELKVLYRREFAQAADFQIIAKAEVYARNASDLAAQPSLPANINTMQQLLFSIQDAVAFSKQYGYANYNTIGYAMRVETDLVYLLRKSKKLKQETFNYYKLYFQDCLKAEVSGSVTNVKVTAIEVMRSLESKFPKQNSTRVDKGIHSWHQERCTGEVHIYQILTGSLANGFSGNISAEDSRRECDSSCRRCDLVRTTGTEEDIVRRFRGELYEQLNSWNEASRLYRELVARVDSLKVAEERVGKLRDVASELYNKAV